MKYSITLFVKPTPKGRAKTAVIGGHARVYTPVKTVKAESLIVASIRQQLHDSRVIGWFDPNAPIKITATFFRERPAHKPKKYVLPTQKPDLDNYFKLLTDALSGYLYANDSQITAVEMKKRYGVPPRIELIVKDEAEL